MARRLGLQARMTISYVVATVVVVLFVEALAGVVVLPHLTSGADATTKAVDLASTIAEQVAVGAQGTGQLPAHLDPAAPAARKLAPLKPAGLVELLIDRNGRIVDSDDPLKFPIGVDAMPLLPPAVGKGGPGLPPLPVETIVGKGASAVAVTPGGKIVWSLVPVVVPDPAAVPVDPTKPGKPVVTVGYVYLQMPAASGAIVPRARVGAGVLVLALTLPVGVAFGLFTTRRLRRRLRELAAASQAVATGDFSTRVVPVGDDEVGKLERNFNDMTARLGDAGRRELELATLNARLAERSRISRELHDSISQDLFSLAMLSGGLQRAVPADSPLQDAIGSIADTVATTIHEMRALVLDLHPTVLTEKGLGAALEDLCGSYRARLGLDVVAELEPVELEPAAEHGVLRVAQEAVGNAARHADARTITVALRPTDAGAELLVADDGRGFDPAVINPSSGVGLRLMRERMAELGGSLEVDSVVGGGTRVRAAFPVRVRVP